MADPIKDSLQQPIRDGVGLIPHSSQVVLDDQVIRPTVSVMMPLYTGGLTSNAKEIANIQAKRSAISSEQQQDVQRFELIQAYFNAQLQKKISRKQPLQFKCDARHYANALKMEQQGFISKGQRINLKWRRIMHSELFKILKRISGSSLFKLNNLMQSSQITDLYNAIIYQSATQSKYNRLTKKLSGSV